MDRIALESVTHIQEGHPIEYVMRAGQDDWFCNRLRAGPHANPAWFHLHRRRVTEGRLLRYADFGANIGTTALLPARIGHQVLAVEAGAENVFLLTEARRRNRLQSQLTIAQWAAAAERGMVSFYEASAWGSTKVSETHAHEAQVTRVPGATAAEILDLFAMPNVDLIKMDIEGAELAALTGFDALLARNPEVELIVETNWETCQLHDHAPQDVWARLQGYGFDTYLLQGKYLTPVTPHMPQPRFVCDVLATRRSFDELQVRLGYEERPMDYEGLPEALRAMEPGDRPLEMVESYIAAQIARVPVEA
jgi:FkbM family methyltransferase